MPRQPRRTVILPQPLCVVCGRRFRFLPGHRRCLCCCRLLQTVPPADPGDSHVLVRFTSHGVPLHGAWLRCWVPENCRLVPGSRVVFDLLPSNKGFAINDVMVKPARLTETENEVEVEGRTPLLVLFKCEYIPVHDESPEDRKKPGFSVFNKGCFITTTTLCLLWESEDDERQKGGGVLKFLLTRIGHTLVVAENVSEYLPNLEVEE